MSKLASHSLGLTAAALVLAGQGSASCASWMISGNENKIDLSTGATLVVPDAGPDSLTLLDFAQFPPSVLHVTNVPNTVIGPPSNIALSPTRPIALIANSVQLDAASPTGFSPASQVHILDLSVKPPRVVGEVEAGRQPSGISFTADGEMALVANRAGGTVSVLRMEGKSVRVAQTLTVCLPEEGASDVAIHPRGHLALVSIQKGGYLRVLEVVDGTVQVSDRKVSVYGQPYRCVITPDGQLGLTAGQGAGNGLDADALSVVDLEETPIRTVDYVALGAVPESIEVSPDGQLVAAVLMEGSNLEPDHPYYRPQGSLVVLRRQGRTFEKVQTLPVGRIPEGVAFTADGRHVVVQCHPDRELWVFRVRNGRLQDTGHRIPVPGMPSSLRAGR